MKTHLAAFLAVSFLLCTTQSTLAQDLEGFFPAGGGQNTVQPTGSPISAGGLQFVPIEGTVTAGESPAPFAFFIPSSQNPENVTIGVLGTPVTIDGPTTLDVLASADAVIEGSWGNGVVPEPFIITGGAAATGLKGSFPFDGGPLTIEPRSESNPYTATELSFEATAGSLTGGGSAAPFESLIENTAQRWSVNSSAGITIDGPVALDVLASAGASISGLSSDGTESTMVEVIRNDPEPTTALFGSYARDGGAITIEPSAGPVTTRGLDLSGRGLSAIGDASPAPYSSLDINNENQWKVSSSTDVIIDGRVTLNVEAADNAFVQGIVTCLLYTSPSPRDKRQSRMPSSA